eukprot:gene10873-20236_t
MEVDEPGDWEAPGKAAVQLAILATGPKPRRRCARRDHYSAVTFNVQGLHCKSAPRGSRTEAREKLQWACEMVYGMEAGIVVLTETKLDATECPDWMGGMRAFWACRRHNKTGVAVLLEPTLAAGVTQADVCDMLPGA